MLGQFLRQDARELISAANPSADVLRHTNELLDDGYTVIPGAVSEATCAEAIEAFRRFERDNEALFSQHRDANGHYPRIVNLHNALPQLTELFTRNPLLLDTLDALFGARASLYTSLFYEVGSQQPLHRDTPVFATRPEYLYFGATVYLEPADDGNGCLEVMVGGHRVRELDREALAMRHYGNLDAIPPIDNDAWVEYQDRVVALGKADGLQVRKVHVKTGDTLIWHPQLPHGGSVIEDRTRTRFSLVMHVTPENVPVYHQNVFFNPSRKFPETPHWKYLEHDGRLIVDQRPNGISMGHEHVYPMERYNIGAGA